MNTEQELEAFEAWWEKEGQYCRAGGGDYEKTFAYRAYQAGRAAQAGGKVDPALFGQCKSIIEDAERYRAWRQAAINEDGLIDALAQEIRRVDGQHALGAGALAEALMPFIQNALQSQDQEDAERYRFIRSKVYASNAYGRASWKFHYDNLPLPLDNPTRGSVKQHFEDAIDHARRVEGER